MVFSLYKGDQNQFVGSIGNIDISYFAHKMSLEEYRDRLKMTDHTISPGIIGLLNNMSPYLEVANAVYRTMLSENGFGLVGESHNEQIVAVFMAQASANTTAGIKINGRPVIFFDELSSAVTHQSVKLDDFLQSRPFYYSLPGLTLDQTRLIQDLQLRATDIRLGRTVNLGQIYKGFEMSTMDMDPLREPIRHLLDTLIAHYPVRDKRAFYTDYSAAFTAFNIQREHIWQSFISRTLEELFVLGIKPIVVFRGGEAHIQRMSTFFKGLSL